MDFVEIKDIFKTYAKPNGEPFNALDGVSLTIRRKEILALLGVNGAGKTTLSSIIATLHPPTRGDILFKGASIYHHLLDYRKALGFCPQRQNLDIQLTVEENLLFAGRYFLLPETLVHTRAHELMTRFNLTRYASYAINALSGGTKQRILIARALMHNPEILILDEPTVGLDPDVRRLLWQHIKELKAQGMTIILTTHYLDEAEALADRVCILSKGKVLLVASMQELKEQHQATSFEDVFLSLTRDPQAIDQAEHEENHG
jgi:ABC-2 type transport system ATP-binding protein